ncbi:hypothetical protein [Leifsonia shinshuensis]|uniref:hypothetical protein n=1 Tax=Leifsonia shinshuensis TaxID=150026 RepID=UPI00285A5692|nr:hypothetical protein [Leifsonia shinshuensis]MDR6972721.1 hypothetical protein [Leifsonia shinshuensis]
MKKIYQAAIAAAAAAALALTAASGATAAPANGELQAPNQLITHVTPDYRCTTSYETNNNAGFMQIRTRLSCSRIAPGVELRAAAMMLNYSGPGTPVPDYATAHTKWIGSNDYGYVFYSGWSTVGLYSGNPGVLNTFIEQR